MLSIYTNKNYPLLFKIKEKDKIKTIKLDLILKTNNSGLYLHKYLIYVDN